MTIFSDDVLMLTAAEMEEWYEHELLLRSEHELRRQRLQGAPAPGPVSIASITGDVVANNNMLPAPTDFSGNTQSFIAPNGQTAAWTLVNSSVSILTTKRPDGSAEQKFIEDTTNNQHKIFAFTTGGLSPTANTFSHTLYRFAVLAKPAERTRFVAFLDINSGGASNRAASVGFDLDSAQVFDHATDTNWTFIGANITRVAGGYLLCTTDAVYTDSATPVYRNYDPYILLDNGTGLAPRNISYTGDGKSGIFLWWMNLLPKGAWSLTKLDFFDDFSTIATIDVNDTRAAGFNWYVHNLFPNCCIHTFGLVTNPPSAPTLPNTISVANSVCTLFNPNPDNPATRGFTSQLWSVCYTGDIVGAPGYRGYTYKWPAFYEARFGYDAATLFNPGSSAGHPSIWGLSIAGLINANATEMFEQDICEGVNRNFSDGMHDYITNGSGTLLNAFATGDTFNYPSNWNPSPTDASQALQHRYSNLLLDPASNDGVFGLRMAFYDGSFWGSVVLFSATTDTLPPSGFPAGTFSNLPNNIHPLFFNTGEHPSVRMDVDWIKLYQKP